MANDHDCFMLASWPKLPSKALVSIEKRCLLLDSTLGHTTLLYLVTPATAFESDTFAEIPKLLP